MPDLPDLDEAVRAAAWAIAENSLCEHLDGEDGCIDCDARAAVEAAAPLIGAAYLEDLAAAIDAERERDRGRIASYEDSFRDYGYAQGCSDVAAIVRAHAAGCRATTDRDAEPGADDHVDAPSKSVARRLARTEPDADPNP